jgi:hypothetical protein
MTWPLAAYVGNHIFGKSGDNFYFLWLIRWLEGAAGRLPASPLIVPGLNFPEGWSLAYNEIPWTMVLQALPVSVFFGPAAGFNFSIGLSFLLSGMGAYFFARRLTNSVGAALLSGTIFAYAPYRFGHLMGHFNLMGTQWIPFYFLFLYRCLEDIGRSGRFRRRLATAALFLALIGLTSPYYLYMSLVLTAVFIAVFFFAGLGPAPSERSGKTAPRIALAGLTLGLVALACALPYLSLSAQVPFAPRSGEEMAYWSPSAADFLLPPPFHFLFGAWIRGHFERGQWAEKNLFLGFVPILLAILALATAKRTIGDRHKLLFLGLMFACALVLALGTNLTILPGPPGPAGSSGPIAPPGLPLPGLLLAKLLPFYDRMRVFARYGIFAVLFIALLAAFGARRMFALSRSRRGAVAIAAILTALVAVEFKQVRLPMIRVEGRSVDRWLAGQPGDGAVAEFPASAMALPEGVYFASLHGKPYVGAFFSGTVSPQWARILPVLSGFPDPASIALLADLKVRFVLVDSSKYPDFGRVRDEIVRRGLRHLAAEGKIHVFERP